MVVDRQKGQNQIRVQEVQSGRQVRSGRYKVQKQARVKTGRTRKRRMQKAGEREKSLVDLETYKVNWHRETGNTGINTLGKTSDTWSEVETITRTGETDQGVTVPDVD
jgi:hypothetical protein